MREDAKARLNEAKQREFLRKEKEAKERKRDRQEEMRKRKAESEIPGEIAEPVVGPYADGSLRQPSEVGREN